MEGAYIFFPFVVSGTDLEKKHVETLVVAYVSFKAGVAD